MAEPVFGFIAAYTAAIGLTIWIGHQSSKQNAEKKYEKNREQIEFETLKVKTLAQEIKSGMDNIKLRQTARLDMTEAQVGTLAQQLSSDINNLEIKMNSLETNMTTDFRNFKSDVNQKIKKLENQQDQLGVHSRRLKFRQFRNRVTPFILSDDCGKLSQATVIKSDHQIPTKAVMDELYQTNYKDKLTPTEFEQFSQLFVSVLAAAARNDGTLGPKLKELFSKPVVLKLFQLPKKV